MNTRKRFYLNTKNPGAKRRTVFGAKAGTKFLFVGIAAAILLPVGLNAQTRVMRPGIDFKTGQVIVEYKQHVTGSRASSNARTAGRKVMRSLSHRPHGSGVIQVQALRPGQSVQDAVRSLSRNADVKHVQPNYIYKKLAVPNDTDYGQLWGLKNTGQTITGPSYSTNNPGTSGLDINAQTAWDTITDCSSITVAVIDGGVNYTHEDLAGNMVNGSYSCPGGTGTRGCDFVGTGDADPADLDGHGTHVAATIGAVGNNSKGVTGVCWDAKLLAVRVLDASGSGTTADIVEGLSFAAGQAAGQGQAKVINMSLGGPTFDSLFSSAITTARNNDVIIIVAAGNDGANLSSSNAYPCEYTQDNIICVTAMDQSYALASFGNFDTRGVASNAVDIGAPGTNILSATFGTSTTINDDFNTAGVLNWTASPSGGFGYQSCNLGSTLDLLQVPGSGTTWCGFGTPANNIDHRVYKNFNLAGYDGAVVSFIAWIQLSSFLDRFVAAHRAAGGDPTVLGTQFVSAWQVDTGGFSALSYDISSCNTSTCTVGFRVDTDSTTNNAGDGVALALFSIQGRTITTNGYEVMDGTSMASPQVAGIAALVRARNPNFTYSDVRTAILDGGDLAAALSGKSATGRVADAAGSIRHIPTVTGVAAVAP